MEERETYPDRYKKDVDRAKDDLGWCDTRDLLRKIQDFDGCVQSWEGLGFHGQNSRLPLENRTPRRL